ncbi:MAG: class I SAM-dependent RNA methyltransferase [Litoreibacter sp.]
MDTLEIFLICPPGLQNLLATEAREKGFVVTSMISGGVTMKGNWHDVWRANLVIRGAVRVLVRIASFPVTHLAHLDKLSRKIPWNNWLRTDVPIKVDAVCRKSKIYHEKAAAERVARAASEALKVPLGEGGISIRVRIEDDHCVVSLDTSGAPLHKRGVKVQVNKAPMRENLAALFLRACDYDGSEPVVDPMCGSGTFVIEAAEIAQGMFPGRNREFAFENFAEFSKSTFTDMKTNSAPQSDKPRFYGSDRDAGAVAMSRANAERAGVTNVTSFSHIPLSEAVPPEGRCGLVIVNPPYGARVGASKSLHGLYAGFGARMRAVYAGWRVGMITTDRALVQATGLPFSKPGPVVDHGGIKVRLYQCELA